MRIAVYAIALNEAKHVERFLAACREADVVVVADTGSSDDTVDAFRRGGALTHRIAIRPWRFDDARNAALALVPDDVDVCFSLDIDEIPASGWRGAVEAGWTEETTMGRYRFVTGHRPDGAPSVEISGAKLHVRFGYRWQHLCHEVLMPDRLKRERHTWLEGLRVDHWPDTSKDRSLYLPMMEAAVAEAPDDARDLFLLGREYAVHRKWDEAEVMLRRYLKVVGNRWPEQRASAWRRLARCRKGLGDADGALECLQEGLRTFDDRDLWLDLADQHAEAECWSEAYRAAMRGLAMEITAGFVSNEHMHAGGRPFHRASLAAWRLGRLDEARALALQACALEPGDTQFERHLRELGSA